MGCKSIAGVVFLPKSWKALENRKFTCHRCCGCCCCHCYRRQGSNWGGGGHSYWCCGCGWRCWGSGNCWSGNSGRSGGSGGLNAGCKHQKGSQEQGCALLVGSHACAHVSAGCSAPQNLKSLSLQTEASVGKSAVYHKQVNDTGHRTLLLVEGLRRGSPFRRPYNVQSSSLPVTR